jgi:hypothetical protein
MGNAEVVYTVLEDDVSGNAGQNVSVDAIAAKLHWKCKFDFEKTNACEIRAKGKIMSALPFVLTFSR